MLSFRYFRAGNIDDLHAAITKAEIAVSTTPKNHPNRAEQLSTLVGMQLDRYLWTRNMDDLQAAVSKAELAVSTTPENNPDRARRLGIRGDTLVNRYHRTQDIEDLQAAISNVELALSAAPEDHPDQVKLIQSLGNYLLDQYDRTGNIDDLQAAISKMELAVSATLEGHPDTAGRLILLGIMLSDRSNYGVGDINDLQVAISKAELAISATPENHPDQAARLNDLGFMLSDQYDWTGNFDDLLTSWSTFIDSFDSLSSIPLYRVRGARNAIHISVSRRKWGQASSVAQAAIKLLPFVCGRYLSWEDQQYAILQISGLASDACSLSLKMGHVHQDLQQLEFGRGVILGYLMDGRSDLTKLQHDYPRLANEYGTLSFKAYTDIEEKEPLIREQLLRKRREAATRLEDCLHRIRLESGYEQFLLEPTVDELQQSASEGPIVIVNATDIGCDAIIISTSKVQAIALPEMKFSEAPSFSQQKLGRYRKIGHKQWRSYKRDIEVDTGGADSDQMSWLWLTCVKPILKELKNVQASDSHELPRVWWIGTGIAGSFPFHAAGEYNKELEGYQDSENTMSQTIPSYTPTIKALLYARSCATKAAKTNSRESSILIVTMPTTPERKSLPGVDHEKVAIQQITKDICNVKTLESPTAAQVLNNVSEFDIVHFACHGSVDSKDPSNSHLALQKSSLSGLLVDELTVSDISKKNTQGRTWIAYLSACSTAGVEAKSLADECLHLSSAFQVAGFAHVIGSLWLADDDICVRLAKSFYHSLTKIGTKHSNRAVAEALRNAILDIRAESPDPRLWALFIHSGA